MMQHTSFPSLLLVLTLTACGGSDSDSGSDDDGDPGGDGDTGEYSGTLIASGTGAVHTLDLGSRDPGDLDAWVARDDESVYEAASVVLAENELLVAGDSFGSPLVVEAIDLTTFGVKETFEWRPDDDVGRVNALAASSDGRYLAAYLEALGPQFLEVFDRDEGAIVYTGLDLVWGERLTWTPGDELVFMLNLSHEDNPDRWGAIAAIPLDRLDDVTDELMIDLHVIFTRAEWEAGVSDVAISPDGSQVVYTRGGELWVADFEPGATPHQLTTGPIYDGGAQFSPDGAAIAFAAGDRDFLT
jgi:WD40-like Beta Propeller Repeat